VTRCPLQRSLRKGGLWRKKPTQRTDEKKKVRQTTGLQKNEMQTNLSPEKKGKTKTGRHRNGFDDSKKNIGPTTTETGLTEFHLISQTQGGKKTHGKGTVGVAPTLQNHGEPPGGLDGGACTGKGGKRLKAAKHLLVGEQKKAEVVGCEGAPKACPEQFRGRKRRNKNQKQNRRRKRERKNLKRVYFSKTVEPKVGGADSKPREGTQVWRAVEASKLKKK